MKKIVMGLAVLTAAAVLASGCSGLGGGGGFNPSENSLYIDAGGSVSWASAETYEQGDYTEEELKASAGQKISSYNSSLGREASFENTEGAEKLPVAVVSAKLGDGKAVLVTEYDTPGRLIQFAQEIGDYNVPFTQLDTGRVAVMSEEMSGSSFKDEKGQAADLDAVLKDGQRLAVKVQGQGVVMTEKKVMYVSDNCQLKDANRVETPSEGTGYIILK